MSLRRKGFTIVELLIVMLLIGLVSAMAINLSFRTRHRWELRGLAREITSIFYRAKQLASRENSQTMVDFSNNKYTLHVRRNNAWVQVFGSEDFPKNITLTKTPNDYTGFAIAPSGFLIKPDTMAIYGMQTLVLRAPHGSQFDSITLNIYPYGGVRVKNLFL
jgi:prepilin-type N-terminal cleavage/methylation domain-containing protein